MLSKKTKYGLKALFALARMYNRGPVLIADLAEAEKIPKKFLEYILLTLRNGEILASRKGKGGGYYLAREPRQITIAAAVKVLEGSVAPVACLDGAPAAVCDECVKLATCGIRLAMKDVWDAMSAVMEKTTLADVLERIDLAEENEKELFNFVI